MSLLPKFKIILFCLLMSWFFLTAGQAVLAAGAPAVNNALGNLDVTANQGGISTPTSQTDLPTIIGKIIGAILAFVGVIFFILILWAGFGWMLAQGDEAKITKAKDTIISSVLGLIVILGAYAITQLIATVFSSALTGAPPAP